MGDITTIGLDLAKNVLQFHAVDEAGSVVMRKLLRRGQVLGFFARSIFPFRFSLDMSVRKRSGLSAAI